MIPATSIPGSARRALLVLSMMSVAACSGSPATARPASAAPPASPSAVTAASPSAATSPSSAAPSDAAATDAASPPASGGTGAIPFGMDVCKLLPAATIDQAIGVNITFQAWDNHVCTWISSNPTGGATIGWLAPGSAILAGLSGSTVPAGATVVSGLGLRALGRTQTGMPAPAAPTSALLVVMLPQGGMTVHVSGPAVTLDEAAALAHDVLGS